MLGLMPDGLEPGFLLVTFHPETLATQSAEAQIAAFLKGLGTVTDRKIVITLPNADAGSEAIRAAQLVRARPRRVEGAAGAPVGAAVEHAAATHHRCRRRRRRRSANAWARSR